MHGTARGNKIIFNRRSPRLEAEQPTNLPPARPLRLARNHDHGNGKWRHAVQLPISVEARAARLRRRSRTQYDG